jgi:hypothetical protein
MQTEWLHQSSALADLMKTKIEAKGCRRTAMNANAGSGRKRAASAVRRVVIQDVQEVMAGPL